MPRAADGRTHIESPADALGLLAHLPQRERAVLTRCAIPLQFPAQSFLYHRDQPGHSLYILSRGRVGIWTGGERGNPTLVNTLGPGEVVGEAAVLGTRRLRTASVQALTAVTALQFDARDIDEVLRTHPRAYVLFIDVLVRRIDSLNARVGEFRELDGTTRVYRQLCTLAETGRAAGRSTTIPVAQHHLASLAGVSLRSASAVLTAARRAGLVTTSRTAITVTDWPTVRRRAGLPPTARATGS